jgi:NAD-dependent SIR2 family protein deacetylase
LFIFEEQRENQNNDKNIVLCFLDEVMKQQVPRCRKCGGLIKPDIVFFGENLPPHFFQLQDFVYYVNFKMSLQRI